ncbi:MAG: 3-deoxy-manno-octulosonate cytidylyltransferase [Prevotellaceae bacterium]|nr:3-deoxy-manno-octulosonate cytidylyltransferase [Prevotellaceae bacterium]
MADTVIIIPARYGSTRFPGKPLAMLCGKPIIQHVYERANSVIQDTYVATDDERILKQVEDFGGKAIMTRSDHRSGTDRCREALSKIGVDKYDIVINVQGDEPFIHPSQIIALQDCFDNPGTQIATLAKPFDQDASDDAVLNPNCVKVVIGKDNQALYFSRSAIPYARNPIVQPYYKHLGIYGYRAEVLSEITNLEQTPLEIAESLEQLRWLENGYHITVGITNRETIGIDTPDDLTRAEQQLKHNN